MTIHIEIITAVSLGKGGRNYLNQLRSYSSYPKQIELLKETYICIQQYILSIDIQSEEKLFSATSSLAYRPTYLKWDCKNDIIRSCTSFVNVIFPGSEARILNRSHDLNRTIKGVSHYTWRDLASFREVVRSWMVCHYCPVCSLICVRN